MCGVAWGGRDGVGWGFAALSGGVGGVGCGVSVEVGWGSSLACPGWLELAGLDK